MAVNGTTVVAGRLLVIIVAVDGCVQAEVSLRRQEYTHISKGKRTCEKCEKGVVSGNSGSLGEVLRTSHVSLP